MKKGKKIQRVIDDMKISTFCDLCKQEIVQRNWDRSEITICAQIGSYYPECDARNAEETDVCKTCWPEVRKTLEVLGCKFRRYDLSYSSYEDTVDEIEEAE